MNTPLPMNECNAYELLESLDRLVEAIGNEGLRHSEQCDCEWCHELAKADELLRYYETGKLT